MILIVIPTFREPEHVAHLLSDLSEQRNRDFHVTVVNASPGDETSALVRSYTSSLAVNELPARKNDFWTGSVARGVRYATSNPDRYSAVLFLNCDLRVPPDLTEQAAHDMARYPDSVTCYAAHAGGKYVTSGVSMRSWPLSWTRHEPRGALRPAGQRILVDMLAGRALLIALRWIDRIGEPDRLRLPHYGADYEYTRRVVRHGGTCVVSTEVTVESDVHNTGARASHRGTRFAGRLKMLWSKRSPSNLLYRTRFVYLTYPRGTRVLGFLSIFAKTAVELLFGHRAFRGSARHHVVS